MGQTPVCSFCSDNEKDMEFKPENKKINIIFSQSKILPKTDNIILQKENVYSHPNSLKLTYIGGYYKSQKEGFNILKWENKSEFKGIFHNGIIQSWGIFYNPKIGKYNGEYYYSKKNGYGIFRHITGSIYEGNWVNEKQEGIGIEKWKDNSSYQGEFIGGEKCGIGIYFFPDGNVYLGEWKQNKMNGHGIYSYNKNKLYMGEWANGLRNGYGEIYSPNQNNYFFGFFNNNIKNGFFILYNLKSKKIIIGFNTNGKTDEIVKYFRRKEEGKLMVVKNGRKIKEIDDNKMIDYLSNKDNFDKNGHYLKYKEFQKYFFMNRIELEKILDNKIDLYEINSINERLGKNNEEII